MNAEPIIFEALMAKLRDFGEPEVAWPNMGYAPKSTTPYLRPTVLFGFSNIPGVADDDTAQYDGIFQVDIFWPENQGLTQPINKAKALEDYFAKGTDLSTDEVKIKIQNKPFISPAQQEPGWVQVPVSVPWRAFA
jgi:Bacteriophage related domain of unknown function